MSITEVSKVRKRESEPTEALRDALAAAMPHRAFQLRLWDGTELDGTDGDGPLIEVRDPTALAHLLRAPGQLGLARAYVSGVLDTDDLDGIAGLLKDFEGPDLRSAAGLRLAAAAVRAARGARLPRVPRVELRPHGALHSIRRDSRAVRHHYDVSNEFFALFLDESMTYSCAVFSRGATSLEQAQRTKLELVCSKLGLKAGERVLDVGCGWGSFVIHAATHHGARAVGITLSPNQARLAKQRVAEAGLSENVEIRVTDYRQLRSERYDAVASIGMVEHVGARQIDSYASRLSSLLARGGRLLNHGIASLHGGRGRIGAFTQHYVFPDGDLLPVWRIQLALERAGLDVEHVEQFRLDYSRTLSEWSSRLDARLQEAERLVGPERLRVWRLYLRGAKKRFDDNEIAVYQVRASRPAA